MGKGRASAIRFNEWICLSAHFEKAVNRIGRQVYQAHARGLVYDHSANETCKEISQTFADAKKVRQELEEDLERDALHGLSLEESQKAEEVLELSEGAKIKRKVRLKITQLLGRYRVNKQLEGYKNRVEELSKDLGLRAVAIAKDNPLLESKEHAKLCQLAIKLEEESNKAWDEITRSKKESGGSSISFHTILINFMGSFAKYSQDTPLGKMVLKAMKYDSKAEEQKLTKQFEGSKAAAALEVQMAEAEEADYDIGKAIAKLESEYKMIDPEPQKTAKAQASSWESDIDDTWPAQKAEKLPPSAPAKPIAPVIPAAHQPKPQVLRKRGPEVNKAAASAWASSDPFAAPATPQKEESTEGWLGEPPKQNADPGSEKSPVLGGVKYPPAAAPPSSSYKPPERQGTIGNASPPVRPAIPPPAVSPTPTLFQPPTRLEDGPSKAGPSLPSPQRSPMRSLDLSPDSLAAAPPPAMGITRPAPSPPATDLYSDDNLLPSFLRDRKEESSQDSPSAFIPDLPESESSGSDSLRLLPFGLAKEPSEAQEDEPFIPEMPD